MTDLKPFGAGNGAIWLSDVDCEGTETRLDQCRHLAEWGETSCRHYQDAAVTCNMEAPPGNKEMLTLFLRGNRILSLLGKLYSRNTIEGIEDIENTILSMRGNRTALLSLREKRTTCNLFSLRGNRATLLSLFGREMALPLFPCVGIELPNNP